MSKFIALKQAVYQQLDSANECPVYDSQAPQNADFPYQVYKLLPIENTVDNRTDYTLEVSHWNKTDGTSTATISEMTDKTFEALQDFTHLDDNNLIIASEPNIGWIPDDNGKIQRYDVTSTLMTYRR